MLEIEIGKYKSFLLRCCLASGEGIVMLGITLSCCVCVHVHQVATAHRITLGSEGNALYPVFSSLSFASEKNI